MNIIAKRKIFLAVSGLLVASGILAVIGFGFNQGIDFRGGTLWQFKIEKNQPTTVELEGFVKSAVSDISEIRINLDASQNQFFARFKTTTEAEHHTLEAAAQKTYPSFEELSFQSIGPSIGQKLKSNAVTAIILAIVIVSLYIAYAFRKVSRPISSWKYGVVTMITLLHDIAIPAGLIAILGHYLKIEIDSNFIVALLVVMGFSVHDTIVVFDRIRENLIVSKNRADFAETINQSIIQTIARSINTSLTLIIVLIILYLLGPINLKYFILTLLVGVTTGVYSSIFVASPLLLVWHTLTNQTAKNK